MSSFSFFGLRAASLAFKLAMRFSISASISAGIKSLWQILNHSTTALSTSERVITFILVSFRCRFDPLGYCRWTEYSGIARIESRPSFVLLHVKLAIVALVDVNVAVGVSHGR